MSTRSRMIVSTSRPTYPTSVNLVASTLMNGASASRASRRAISVLPTPVGPIIRMFFGVISLRSGSGTCMRRQRLRRAMATARFAAACPTMCLSSSWTICRGVMAARVASCPGPRKVLESSTNFPGWSLFQLFYYDVAIGVDADVRGDVERALDDLASAELGVLQQRTRGRLREGSARAHRHERMLGLDHVAV